LRSDWRPPALSSLTLPFYSADIVALPVVRIDTVAVYWIYGGKVRDGIDYPEFLLLSL
jgi:hypothetical protein